MFLVCGYITLLLLVYYLNYLSLRPPGAVPLAVYHTIQYLPYHSMSGPTASYYTIPFHPTIPYLPCLLLGQEHPNIPNHTIAYLMLGREHPNKTYLTWCWANSIHTYHTIPYHAIPYHTWCWATSSLASLRASGSVSPLSSPTLHSKVYDSTVSILYNTVQCLIVYQKSRIRETKNLSTDADSRTDTILEGLHDISQK